MYIRYLVVALVIVFTGFVGAQPSKAQLQETRGSNQEQYRLYGVVVSESRRTALLNSRVVHEGMRIGGAVIESIDNRQIQVRIGATRQLVRVGGSFTAGPSSDENRATIVVSRSTPGAKRSDGLRRENKQRNGVDIADPQRIANVIRPAPTARTTTVMSGERREHAVASGETLSGIALRYRPDDATINQMMIALFEANPLAFDGNINALKAGATLRIPDRVAADSLAPGTAMARVTQHHQRWRDRRTNAQMQFAEAVPADDKPPDPDRSTPWPVQRGDTLSEIARDMRVPNDDISSAQLMIALFRSNPDAFGKNIDVIYEGAVLRLPDKEIIASLSPAAARAEVQRQMLIARLPEEPGPGLEFDVDTIVSTEEHALLRSQHW